MKPYKGNGVTGDIYLSVFVFFHDCMTIPKLFRLYDTKYH